MKRYSFDQLADMNMSELEKIKEATKDQLAEIMQGKFTICAQILFYQEEIAKMREDQPDADPAT